MLLKNEKGLTLAEVLAAAVILGVVIITFLNISGYTAITGKKSSDLTEAMRIAEEQISIARANLPDELPRTETIEGYSVTTQITELDNIDNYNEESFESEHISLQAIILSGTGPKMLTVTVSWGD